MFDAVGEAQLAGGFVTLVGVHCVMVRVFYRLLKPYLVEESSERYVNRILNRRPICRTGSLCAIATRHFGASGAS